jgi:hypothetical protein
MILEESPLLLEMFSLRDNSRLRNTTLHTRLLADYKQLGCEGDQSPFFRLRCDKSEVTYQISINKQLREITQLETPSCGTTLQCIMLSNLM